MTQVDFINYFSILFWFFILFIIYYLINYSFLLPNLYSMLIVRFLLNNNYLIKIFFFLILTIFGVHCLTLFVVMIFFCGLFDLKAIMKKISFLMLSDPSTHFLTDYLLENENGLEDADKNKKEFKKFYIRLLVMGGCYTIASILKDETLHSFLYVYFPSCIIGMVLEELLHLNEEIPLKSEEVKQEVNKNE